MSDLTGPALLVPRSGGTDVLVVEERPAPEPGPGEVLVEVAAVGVNFVDVYQREGVYPMETPFVAGNEAAGTVLATGEGVTGLEPGARVAWAMTVGSAARHVAVPADQVVPVPDEVGLETAAAVMLQGMTAHYLTASTYPVTPGTLALVHAAAGGVGQLLVQLVRARGGVVVATAGGPDKCATAARMGADHVIDYRAVDDPAAAVRDAAGRGVDVAYDGVGRDTFDASLAALRPRGVLALFGAASGQVPPLDLQRLNTGGSLFVTRPSLAHYLASREELLWRAGEVLGAVADGSLEVAVGGRYPLRDAPQAYADLESRRTQGKLLLLP
ncbi:quinone oxidoreductase [Phycicoccus endophyticus]|uniref:Quinone oxidoreductase n=1 Tax=Phycicoccus endophyticus TaxID=1690220 RepID=A0A7G9R2P0_9MICO|nr:quinone oxidoreductase [Phycicoccus endophyticus]NHI20331.1 quinone oxidoreductase [Phycicoccus endophyticus]QNN49865.1 quinone oxidoreductase [Phycicoccus endophyticus]GGL30060.1 quinone oxidoreductase [Phycicoccus endophyticus]